MDQQNVQNEIRDLRELVNSTITYRQGTWNKKNFGNWHKLWCAMDNLEDTQSAIDEFEQSKNPTLLLIYGILQSLVVQQEALKHIEEALDIEVPKLANDYPELQKIRDIRNETTGHPTETKTNGRDAKYEKGEVTYSSILRKPDMRILGYVRYSNSGSEMKHVNLDNLTQTQSKLLIKEISKINEMIRDKEMKHKNQFKEERLINYFDQAHYFIQKLYSFEKSRLYSKVNFDFLRDKYGEFKEAVSKRYKIEDISEQGVQIPGLVYEIQKTDQLFTRIADMIMLKDEIDPFDLDVYVEVLRNSIGQLEIMAQEIDEDFNRQL